MTQPVTLCNNTGCKKVLMISTVDGFACIGMQYDTQHYNGNMQYNTLDYDSHEAKSPHMYIT